MNDDIRTKASHKEEDAAFYRRLLENTRKLPKLTIIVSTPKGRYNVMGDWVFPINATTQTGGRFTRIEVLKHR